MAAAVKTEFALDHQGAIVSIHSQSVLSGLSCGCVCPSCGEKLVAKKGEHRAFHFAHHNNESGCAYALETELHIRAKLLIESRMEISLPLYFGKEPNSHEPAGPQQSVVAIDAVRIEGFCLGKKPDVIAIIGGEAYLIEIAVTHFCDDAKIAHYKSHALNAVEIDLSGFDRKADFESQLSSVLFGSGRQPHYWLSLNPLSSIGQRLMQTLRDEAVQLMVLSKASRNELESNMDRIRQIEPKVKDLIKQEESVRALVRRQLSARDKISRMSELDRAISTKLEHLMSLQGKSQNLERELAALFAKEQSLKKASIELMDGQAKLQHDRRVLSDQEKALALREDALQRLHQDLQEHGISLRDIRSLKDSLDTRSKIEADIIRGQELMALELEKRQRKINELDKKITELLEQKDFYQKTCAKLHRESN